MASGEVATVVVVVVAAAVVVATPLSIGMSTLSLNSVAIATTCCAL